MLCSYPLVIKANKHQNIIISFPLSDLHLKLHQTAKHTKVLHNIPLNNKVGITTGVGIEHKGSIDDEYDGERRDLVYIQIPALA